MYVYVCMCMHMWKEMLADFSILLFFFLAENKNCGAGWEDDQTADCESKFPFILYWEKFDLSYLVKVMFKNLVLFSLFEEWYVEMSVFVL